MTEQHEETGGADGTGTALVERPKGEVRLQAGLADGNRVLAPADWQMLSAIAETVNATEFVPVGLRGNAPKVLACMLYGHALGVSPMIALKEIAVIDGTPSMSSALMVAKVLERGHVITREEIRDGDGVMTGTIAHGRRSDGREDSFAFTIDMARRAGLMGKKNWQNYPEAMLWWRASSQLCSFLFPDVFMGSPYMPEELGLDEPPQGTPEQVAGGAVSLSAVPDPEATREQGQPETAQEAPGGPAGAAKTPEEAAEQLRAKLEGRPNGINLAEAGEQMARGLEGVEPAALDTAVLRDELLGTEPEDFWTPLDDRDPTDLEYAAAKAAVAQATEETDLEELEAAQTLIEAFEETHPPEDDPEVPATGIVVKGTVAEVMLQVVEATERGDADWLRSVLEQEQSSSRPRIRLVAGLQEALATLEARAAAPAPPAAAGFAPAAEDEPAADDVAAAQLDSNPSGHRFDPTVPLEELDHAQLIMRTRASIGYLNDQHEGLKEWKLEAVVAAASRQWKVPVHSLEELEDWQLMEIVRAMPEDTAKVLALMSGEQIEKLAATVPGANPE